MGLKITDFFEYQETKALELPLYSSKIKAGFPSPADDYIEKKLDLNEYLIKHPAATFFVRVEGESMIDAGIHSGDILIVDKSIEVKDNNIVIAAINGEFTVKRISKKNGKLFLLPENNSFQPIEVSIEEDFSIFGVVTCVIHKLD